MVALLPSRFLRTFAPSFCIRAVTLTSFRQLEMFVQHIASFVVLTVQTTGVLRRSVFTSFSSTAAEMVSGHCSSGWLR